MMLYGVCNVGTVDDVEVGSLTVSIVLVVLGVIWLIQIMLNVFNSIG